MTQQRQMTIRLNPELYKQAKEKCKEKFGIGLSPLIKVFLKSFVTQSGVGFYIGDANLCEMFNHWLWKKGMEKHKKGRTPTPGPRLKDLYELNKNK
jgi:hypothetical protein